MMLLSFGFTCIFWYHLLSGKVCKELHHQHTEGGVIEHIGKDKNKTKADPMQILWNTGLSMNPEGAPQNCTHLELPNKQGGNSVPEWTTDAILMKFGQQNGMANLIKGFGPVKEDNINIWRGLVSMICIQWWLTLLEGWLIDLTK